MLSLELACVRLDSITPGVTDPCDEVTKYSAAEFELDFPNFPVVLTDTISQFSI